MSFEIGKTINGGVEWLCGSSLIYRTLSNPVFTALLITAMALITIHVMYKEDLKGTGWRRGLKTGIWLAIGASALVFVHYYALERHLRKGNAAQGVRDVLASIHHSATTGGGYSVYSGPAAGAYRDEADPSDGREAGGSPPRPRPDNVGTPSPAFAKGTGAMDELGLERVVLTSTPGGLTRA
jgi:hypothetical protein